MNDDSQTDQIGIRLATQGDLDELAAIYAECMTGAPGGELWSHDRAKRFLSMWLVRQPMLFFVAELDGKIVGGNVGDIKPYFDGPRFTDGEMFVSPTVRHRGVARALLERRVEDASRLYGVVAMETLANGNSDAVLEWFSRLGFSRTGWVHMEVRMDVLRARLGHDPESKVGAPRDRRDVSVKE